MELSQLSASKPNLHNCEESFATENADDGGEKPHGKGVSTVADSALPYNGNKHDPGPWAPPRIAPGKPDGYSKGSKSMTADRSTATWSTPNERTTSTAPTSTFLGSEAGSCTDDQKAPLVGSKFGVIDRDPEISDDKSEARAGTPACFNSDLVNGIGQNEAFVRVRKELLGLSSLELPQTPLATLQNIQEQQELQSKIRNPDTSTGASSSTRDLECQESRNSPTRRARLRFVAVKLLVVLGRNLIKAIYPPSKKKARCFVVLGTIAAAWTSVALLRKAGHSVADMSISVVAISALGTFIFNALADSSTPLQEVRRLIRTLSWQAPDE